MGTENQQSGLIAQIETIKPWLTEWVEAQEGCGLILFFWVFAASFLGSMVLLCLGVIYWSFGIFFLGLMGVRFFIFLLQIGDSFLKRIDPSHG